MSNSKKEQEELKELEDQAYTELYQIIEEAMQLQDIELLNARIASWKNKYKKLLDTPNPKFKKRIEYLLNQYYSEVAQYILSQIKFKEEKKIENQRKALQKLYSIIKETNDYELLKSKVADWNNKYPISAFLDMYKKKIQIATSDKNLKNNSFHQLDAFYDLVQITKTNGTFDELKSAVTDWEKKYSIHDKYELDDFIKNQTEVKRYTSDEYLSSISSKNIDGTIISCNDVANVTKQANAYHDLIAIMGTHNNIDLVFNWVYKYNSIQFNDKYKELILKATYLEYSPTYLNSLSIPDIDLSASTITISKEQYNNMDDIKKYAVLSYFNMLLPPNLAVNNNYFNKHIRQIYDKSQELKHSPKYNAKDTTSDIIATEKTLTTKIDEIVNIHALQSKDIEEFHNDDKQIETISVSEEVYTDTKPIEIISVSEEVHNDTEPIEIISVPEEVHTNTKPIENISASEEVHTDAEALDYSVLLPEFFKEINYLRMQANFINQQQLTRTKSKSNYTKNNEQKNKTE